MPRGSSPAALCLCRESSPAAQLPHKSPIAASKQVLTVPGGAPGSPQALCWARRDRGLCPIAVWDRVKDGGCPQSPRTWPPCSSAPCCPQPFPSQPCPPLSPRQVGHLQAWGQEQPPQPQPIWSPALQAHKSLFKSSPESEGRARLGRAL